MPAQLTYILFTIRFVHLFEIGTNKMKDDIYHFEILCVYEIPYDCFCRLFTRQMPAAKFPKSITIPAPSRELQRQKKRKATGNDVAHLEQSKKLFVSS